MTDRRDITAEPGMYRHYKGGVYEVAATACHTETGEQLVVYRSGDGEWWTRPAESFAGDTEHGVPRFTALAALGSGHRAPHGSLTPCTCRQAVHAREHRRPTVPGCSWCAASPNDGQNPAAASPRRDDLRELRAWLATERAKAQTADRPDCDPALLVTPHNGIAAGLSIALAWVNHRLGEALDSGPTVAEAAADDRRWFGGEKEGE